MRARNAGGASSWSPVWSFVTLPPVPSRVALITPADTSILLSDSAVFIWQKALPSVDRYVLEVAKDSLFTDKLLADTSIADTARAFKGLADKTRYWWRVAGHNISGWGPFSVANRFSVEIPSTQVLPKHFSFSLGGMVNSRSSIRYALPVAAHVSIRIFGIQGSLVAVLCDGEQPAGYYRVPIRRGDLSNGYYLLDFRAGKYSVKRKLPIFR